MQSHLLQNFSDPYAVLKTLKTLGSGHGRLLPTLTPLFRLSGSWDVSCGNNSSQPAAKNVNNI